MLNLIKNINTPNNFGHAATIWMKTAAAVTKKCRNSHPVDFWAKIFPFSSALNR